MYLEQSLKMQRKGSNSGRRAWNTLRLALLWARKGGTFRIRNKFALSLSLLQKGVKSLRHPNGGAALISGERELSFDETPIIHVKMHRPSSLRFKMPHIPCINPHVDFDYDFELNEDRDRTYYNDVPRKSFLKGVEDHNDDQEDDNDYGFDQVYEDIYGPSDEGIDLKAELFIAKFYEQMKLQRQISYLHYNDMLNRGST